MHGLYYIQVLDIILTTSDILFEKKKRISYRECHIMAMVARLAISLSAFMLCLLKLFNPEKCSGSPVEPTGVGPCSVFHCHEGNEFLMSENELKTSP